MRDALILLPVLLISLTSLAVSQDEGAYGLYETAVSATLPADIVDPFCHTCDSSLCTCDFGFHPQVFGSVEFLLARPNFSEVVAFAEGTQTATTFDVNGQRIDFNYEGGLRALIGIPFGDDSGSLLMEYTFLQGEASSAGTASAPGQFIVDPFGNLVGSVTIIDPSDARFTLHLRVQR
jgi:hypothetical protein